MSSTAPRIRAAMVTASAAAVVLAGCGGQTDPEASNGNGPPVAMATTTQLGSITSEITACMGTDTETLMAPGDDPHVFAPSSAQIGEMSRADLVIGNGLGLEASMQSALDNAVGEGANLVEIAPELDPLPFASHDGHEHDGEHSHDATHDHGGEDPHVWMDVSRMATAAELIGEELVEATGDDGYTECAAQVSADLEETHEQIEDIFAELPEDQRALVTDHAAYNYFADAYGLDISAVVIPGGSTDGEPSSQQLAELSEQISEDGANALVTSAQTQNTMIEALAEETGGAVPLVTLYESGLGEPGSDTETYQSAMVYNARTLVDAITETTETEG